jgi:hypothetical protein
LGQAGACTITVINFIDTQRYRPDPARAFASLPKVADFCGIPVEIDDRANPALPGAISKSSSRRQIQSGKILVHHRFDVSYDPRPRFFFRMGRRGVRFGAEASSILSAGKS